MLHIQGNFSYLLIIHFTRVLNVFLGERVIVIYSFFFAQCYLIIADDYPVFPTTSLAAMVYDCCGQKMQSLVQVFHCQGSNYSIFVQLGVILPQGQKKHEDNSYVRGRAVHQAKNKFVMIRKNNKLELSCAKLRKAKATYQLESSCPLAGRQLPTSLELATYQLETSYPLAGS